jgi:hypothetical protein
VLQRRLVCDYWKIFFAMGNIGINSSLLPKANKSSCQTINSLTVTLTNAIVGPIFPTVKKVFNNYSPDGALFQKIINLRG